ncbi:MAG: histidinol-phosphate aminotransferase family protein [Rhodospirillales bacterium]|nr:histidinol-phosphate aminotransferase family protein [Rhodospirillales bacterium]
MTFVPAPRPVLADPALVRPDRTRPEPRDPNKLWLDKNENPDPVLAGVVREIIAALPAGTHAIYPDLAPLYARLAAHVGVKPANLLLAPGSDGAIRATFETFVAPGETVLITEPTFAMYPVYCRIFGARALPVAYRPSNAGPALSADTMIEAIGRANPRLVCLPNPDSPTGTVFPPADLERIVAAAGAAGAVMLVDEAYYPFHPETIVPWIARHPHLIVARSTGKAWGMAGLRIGFAVADARVAAALHKVRSMYEVGAFSAAVFERMLDRHADVMASVARLEAGKRAFLNAMETLGFRVLRGAGNFCHVAFGARADKIHAALADLVYYREDFAESCLAGFSRFSAATPEQMAPLIARIQSAVRT